MISYTSTRGDNTQYTFSEAILKGIAPDGGLLVQDTIPTFPLEALKKLIGTSYAEKALFVLDLFETDISHEKLKEITEKAYGQKSNFFDPNIAPLVHLKENQYVLEVWHGPTWAFKDMALQLMPLLFSEAIQLDNAKRLQNKKTPLQYLILAATSGDTGKAALEGYKDKEQVSIIVFFPDKRVSSIQELSMITQEGNNLEVYPLSGNFDDTQQLVKNILNDKDFNQKLVDEHALSLSAANSINWGRVVPQIIYYISSYVDLLEKNSISLGQEIDFAVPTGNFGNIFAGFLAKTMGLPIRKLISASNENNVLSEFLQTGVFDAAKRKMIATPSPAMDILVPNNHERLLYFLTNNTDTINTWMQQTKEQKKFILDEETKNKLQDLFYADWVSNVDCLATIKKTFDETGYLIDPHTAVVKEVVNRYKKQQNDHTPIVICSTAHWAKFPNDVYKALFGQYDQSIDEFLMIEKIQKETHASIPKNVLALKNMQVLHKKKLEVNKNVIEKEIENFIQSHI